MARPGKPTTQEIALAINNLCSLLSREYKADWSITVSAQGHTIAASNAHDGMVFPIEGGGRDSSVYF